MALITTKFDLGETVYLIRPERRKVWQICTFCMGAGAILGKDDSERACPGCYGSRGQYVYHEMQWAVVGTLHIGQVGYIYSLLDKEERYMATETGVGTGSVYYAQNLFATAEEAQAECDQRNAEEE
jgi:hypothetical protein